MCSSDLGHQDKDDVLGGIDGRNGRARNCLAWTTRKEEVAREPRGCLPEEQSPTEFVLRQRRHGINVSIHGVSLIAISEL